jgi:hypothetical protein
MSRRDAGATTATATDYRRDAEDAEKGNGTGEITACGRQASIGLKQRRRPQDDDACRIVRKPKSTGKIALLRRAGRCHDGRMARGFCGQAAPGVRAAWPLGG